MKHTKLAWKAKETPGGNIILSTPQGKTICIIEVGRDLPEEESKANAKLISSAPKMLEALQEVNVFLGHIEPRVGEGAFAEISSIVGEAIRKASGITEQDEDTDIDTESKNEPLSKEWPNSSMVAKTEWKDYQLIVAFKNGKTYTYLDFPHEKWFELLNCESIGKYINSNVKGHYSLK